MNKDEYESYLENAEQNQEYIKDMEQNEQNKKCFDDWYDDVNVQLQEKYFELHPEEFPHKDVLFDIEKNSGYQTYCEQLYETYLESD